MQKKSEELSNKVDTQFKVVIRVRPPLGKEKSNPHF